MTVIHSSAQADCPRCAVPFSPEDAQRAVCPNCGWSGQAYLFAPLSRVVVAAAAAMPDDATCAHHPTKRATATCAGSGDYICALCAVELQGQTYSAQYLESAGRDTVGKAFERYLDRPDRNVMHTALVCLLFSGCFFLWPVIVPFGIYQFIRMQKLRRSDPFYARLVGRRNVIGLALVLGAASP